MMHIHERAAQKRRAPKRNKRNGPVTVQLVDARILKIALQIAEGDASKLHIISPTKIEVY